MHARFAIRRLAACIAAAVVVAPVQSAICGTVTLTVHDCTDTTTGNSLRAAVAQANALSDDVVVDLSQLSCSTISLSHGALASTKANLTLQGPTSKRLTIDAGNQSRVITHTAAAGIFIYDLTLASGRVLGGQANGGCVYSSTSVKLLRSNAIYCSTLGTSGSKGGAIYAKSIAGIFNGSAYGNLAYASGGDVYGGAIYAPQVILSASTIRGNDAVTPIGHSSSGGAIATKLLAADHSTISGNRATEGGGVLINTNGSGFISESTISGNTADQCGGGIYSKYSLDAENSTIAFNRASQESTTRSCIGGGIYSGALSKSVTLQSSIVADNLGSAEGADFASDFDASPGSMNTANTISGSHNLVAVTDGGSRAPPNDSLHTDPKLMPLSGNGGRTQTHALAANSPAIDHGSNPNDDATDQRGTTRTLGAATDIGAVEFNPDDIFYSGFD